MSPLQHVSLAVCRWAAWAPGLEDAESWRAWAEGTRSIEGTATPDVQFVAPLLRRRLSRLSRMVFRVAEDCLADNDRDIAHVFCSRYGEFHRSFGILTALAKDEGVSAAAFSNSVHNTSASLFAISKKDTSPSTAVAGYDSTLETAFMEAWSLLSTRVAPAALLVYHDEPLPAFYGPQPTTVFHSAAFAMLLRPTESEPHSANLTLSWNAHERNISETKRPHDPALQVLRLLLTGGDPLVLDGERLVWTWNVDNRVP